MLNIYGQIKEFTERGEFSALINFLIDTLSSPTSIFAELFLKYQLAEAYYENREFTKALQTAEDILNSIQLTNNFILEGNVENLLGKIYRIHQRYEEALSHYTNALNAFKEAKNDYGLAKVYHNIGNVYILTEEFKKAKSYHEKALKLAINKKDNGSIASSYLNLGSLEYQKGEIDNAIDYLTKAYGIFEQLGDKTSLAAVNLNLSEAFYLRRDLRKAEEHNQAALTLYESQNHKIGIKTTLITQARIQKMQHTYPKAINTLKKVRDLDPSNETILLELGELYALQNQSEEATEVYEKIRVLENRSIKGEIISHDHLGRVALNQQKYLKALSHFKFVLKALERTSPPDKGSILATKGNIGLTHLHLKQYNESLALLNQIHSQFLKSRDYEELITLEDNYISILIQDGENSLAFPVLEEKLLPIFKKLNDIIREIQYTYQLCFIYFLSDEINKSKELWQKSAKQGDILPKPPILQNPIFSELDRLNLAKKNDEFIAFLSE